jgi:hypothetical protein
MKSLIAKIALSAVILAPGMAFAQDHHDDHRDDHRYYDKHHKDYHNWNSHEDRAWHIYLEQHHRKYMDFDRARESDRQAYWAWRHDHSDALLRIDIH